MTPKQTFVSIENISYKKFKCVSPCFLWKSLWMNKGSVVESESFFEKRKVLSAHCLCFWGIPTVSTFVIVSITFVTVFALLAWDLFWLLSALCLQNRVIYPFFLNTHAKGNSSLKYNTWLSCLYRLGSCNYFMYTFFSL